jgi:F0F1-type ATP synthase assembly protein I
MPPISEQPRAAVAPVARMAADEARGDAPHSDIRSAARGLDHSSIMAAELIAALLTWAGIGWLLDRWLGTGPWMLSIGALVGNAAGLYLIWLRSGRMEGFDGATTRFAPTASTAAASSASTAPSDGADER